MKKNPAGLLNADSQFNTELLAVVLQVVFQFVTIISPGSYCPMLHLTLSCGVVWNISQKSRYSTFLQRGKSGWFCCQLVPHKYVCYSLEPYYPLGAENLIVGSSNFPHIKVINEGSVIHWFLFPTTPFSLNICTIVFLSQSSRNSLIFYNHMKVFTNFVYCFS